MRGLQRPTQWALNKATELGGMMARLETRLLPQMDDAANHPTYVLFITTHRQSLEQQREFTFWNERLLQLIDQEQKMLGHDLKTARDRADFQTNIAVPMRCAFWYGWETAQNLQGRYQAMTGHPDRAIPAPASRTSSRSADLSTVDLLDNEPVWDMLAERVIDGVGPVPETVKA